MYCGGRALIRESLRCPLAVVRCTALDLAARGEEVALEPDSCRHLPSCTETGTRKLEEPFSACQAATSVTDGLSGLAWRQCPVKCLGAKLPAKGMECLGFLRIQDLLG